MGQTSCTCLSNMAIELELTGRRPGEARAAVTNLIVQSTMVTPSVSYAVKWHDEVPGTRWFRADLHVHTLDDVGGGNLSWRPPRELPVPNDPSDAATRAAYVRSFLAAAVDAGIEVLALTPHSAHVPQHRDISVAWDIVEAWQTAKDDDGTPYREKIYAVFPGFE